MATKKLVPRANNEGGLGTAAKTWGASWLQNLTITNLQTTTSLSVLVETAGNVEKRNAGGLCTDVADTESATTWVGLWDAATGCLMPYTDESLLYDASAEILNLIGTLKMGTNTNTNDHVIHRAAVSGQANGGSLSIKGGDTVGGVDHAGGYLNLYPGLGTGTGGGVSSGISLYSARTGLSGTTAQLYTKNVLFYSLGMYMAQRTFSPISSNDYYEMKVGVSGAATITTKDSGAANAAHLQTTIDGDITFDALGADHKWATVGTQQMHLNSTGLTINNIPTEAAPVSVLVDNATTPGLVSKIAVGSFGVDVQDTEDATCWVGLWESATGTQLPKTDEQLFYNALTGAFYVGGTATTDSLMIKKQHIQAQADLVIEAANLSSLSFDSTLGHMFFHGGVYGQLADLSNTGLLINNIPAEAAPTHVLVDNIADPGLVSKMSISSLPTTLIGVLDTADASCYLGLWESATGNLAPKTDEDLLYNASPGNKMLTVIGTLTVGATTHSNNHKITRGPRDTGFAGGGLYVEAGSATGTDLSGGKLFLTDGQGTGAGACTGVAIQTSVPESASGTTLQGKVNSAVWNATQSAARFKTESVQNGADYFGYDVEANGATTIRTIDGIGADAHLKIIADGDIEIESATHTTFKNSTGTMATVETLRQREYMFALSDETSILTTGTKLTCRIPNNFTLTGIYLNCNTAPTGAAIIVDITDDGTSIFDNGTNNGVRPSIAIGAKTNSNAGFTFAQGGAAATGSVNIVADSEVIFEVDQVGSTIAGKGLKINLVGFNSV